MPDLHPNDRREPGAERLPTIEGDFRLELIRKAIHLCSLSIPLFYYNTSRELTLIVIIPVALVFFVIDVARYYNRTIEGLFYRRFGVLLRRHETNRSRKTLNGATYVLIAAGLCVAIFPKMIAITSFTVLIFSDMTSALVGRRYGRHRFFNKSLEGSLGFFVSAVLVILLVHRFTPTPGELAIGIAASAIGAVVEALPIEIDDNLSIPVSVGFTLWGLYLLLLPTINLDLMK